MSHSRRFRSFNWAWQGYRVRPLSKLADLPGGAFMEPPQILRADNLLITVRTGDIPPRGKKLQLYPANLTYSTPMMFCKALGRMVWHRVRRVYLA